MSSSAPRAPVGLLLTLVACLWALPSSRASADYDALVAQAIAAQEKADYELAHRLFAEAHALAPNARTLRGMGVASYQAGAFVRAIPELEAALVHPHKELTSELRSAVEILRRRALGQVGSLSLRVLPREAQLSIDGAPVPGDDHQRILLEPGTRALRLSAAGYEEQRLEVQVVAGMEQSLSVSLKPLSAAAAPSAPPKSVDEVAPAPRPQRSQRAVRAQTRQRSLRASYVLIGLGAAAGITGGALFGAANGRVTSIADACRETEANECSEAQADSAVEDARFPRFERSINALLGVAGATLLGAVGLLSFGLSGERELDVALDAHGISVTGTF